MIKKSYSFQLARFLILLCVDLIIFYGTVFPGEILVNKETTAFRITSKSYHALSCSATISAIHYRDVQTNSGPFTELLIPGYGYSNKSGDPKLPVIHKLIEVPLNAGYSIEVNPGSYQEYDLSSLGIKNLIFPAQPPLSKNIKDQGSVPFVINEAVYKMNQWIGGPLVKMTPIGIMRSLNLARLDISPVWYNPATGRIRVYEALDIKITYTHPDIESTIRLKKQTWSPYFKSLYSKVGNYMQMPDSLITNAPVTYVIIADPAFRETLQSFIAWKKKKGFNVIVGYTDNPTVGTTIASIKNYLQGLYNAPPAGFQKPSFILFAGDVGQIPAWMPDGHPSDLPYCDYTGDNLPDVFYGRFAAQNVTQLQAYIDKTLEYEEYTMPSDSFLGEVTMVAGADATNGPLYGNGQINYGTSTYFNSAHSIYSNTYLQPEPSGGNYPQNIHQNVSDGVAFANYSAHGSEDGWANPEFLIGDIAPLQNNHKYCLMVGNCCKTANYSIDCFAKEITRTPQKGALGYIGCSDYSYWDEDYWWACGYKTVSTEPVYDSLHLGAYDGAFHDHGENPSEWFETMGQMVCAGDLAVEESSSGIKQYYWETYNLMGDPSLSVYYSVPGPLAASYPATIVIGISMLQVTTEPYAYVALSEHDTTLLAAGCADTSGIVHLTFNPLTTPDSISIVITKQNRKPYIGFIQVVPASGPYVVLSDYTVNDSLGGNNNHLADFGETILLNTTVNNIGLTGSSNIKGILSTQDTNVTINSGTFNFGPVAAGGYVTGQNAFSITVHQNIQDQHNVNFDLVLTNDTSNWTSTLLLTLNAPNLKVNSIMVLDSIPGGNNNGQFDPGESGQLRIQVVNSGHAACPDVISQLSVPSSFAPYIQFANGNYYLGVIEEGASVYSNFPVITNDLTPPGTKVNLDYLVTGGTLNQYIYPDTVNLMIGQEPQFDMKNDTTVTCFGKFYDSGGPGSNYNDLEDFIYTFLPGTSGAKVKVVFNSFNVEEETNCGYDWLKVFDGPDISSPLLGTFCGSAIPGPFLSTTGPLTFQFHSDYSVNLPGWDADISCSGGPLYIEANGFPDNICLGKSAQLVANATGGSGNYSYHWEPGTYLDDPTSRTPVSTPLSDISYTVTVSDGTSTLTSAEITVNVNPLPVAPSISYSNGSLISNASLGNQWYLNEALISDATDPVYSPVVPGMYYATVSDNLTSCPSIPSNRIYYPSTGLDQLDLKKTVNVYPNPFREYIYLSYETSESGKVSISLLDALGKELRVIVDNPQQVAGKHKIEMNAGSLHNGLYLLKVQTPDVTLMKRVLLIR
jgi:hypothetical protein